MEFESGDKTSVCICDEKFLNDLGRLKRLRDFFLQEAIEIPPEESCFLSFGELNLLRPGPNGRRPTEAEWTDLEDRTQVLFGRLTYSLRHRFLLGEIPSWITTLSMAMALLALLALMGAIFIPFEFQMETMRARVLALPFYLVWLMSLGAIGSIAFVGMNALSVQQDVTFDLGNHRLMALRISLGALFGLVLALPFGFNDFIQFLSGIIQGKQETTAGASDSHVLTIRALMLLLPFVLGFSTPLVIMILNRLIDSIQAFFGRTSANVAESSPARPPSSISLSRVAPKPGLTTRQPTPSQ